MTVSSIRSSLILPITKKTYEFTLLGNLTPELVHKLETGVILKGADTPTVPAEITVTGHAVMSDILSTLPVEIQKDIHKTVLNTLLPME